MSAPIIGITVSQVKSRYRVQNYSPSAYARAITQAGGVPLLIPNEYPLEKIPDLFHILGGLLLSGGGDVDVSLYQGIEHPLVDGVSHERDQLEIALLKHALKISKPVLGICRGLQLINVALGGTLYTDIPDQYPTETQHSTPESKGRDFIAHDVSLDTHSKLGSIIGQEHLQVNSFHHQAILKTAPGLLVTAHASDGLIEAVELPGERFSLLAVQWHPEDLTSQPQHYKIFKSFVSAAQ